MGQRIDGRRCDRHDYGHATPLVFITGPSPAYASIVTSAVTANAEAAPQVCGSVNATAPAIINGQGLPIVALVIAAILGATQAVLASGKRVIGHSRVFNGGPTPAELLSIGASQPSKAICHADSPLAGGVSAP